MHYICWHYIGGVFIKVKLKKYAARAFHNNCESMRFNKIKTMGGGSGKVKMTQNRQKDHKTVKQYKTMTH